MQERERQFEKKLKKANDEKIAILKHKTQANQEKRQAALKNYEQINKEKEDEGFKAFSRNIIDIQTRLKQSELEQQAFDNSLFKSFKQWEAEKEQRKMREKEIQESNDQRA